MDDEMLVEIDADPLLAPNISDQISFLSTSDGFQAAQDDYFSRQLDKEIESGLLDQEIRTEEMLRELMTELVGIVADLEEIPSQVKESAPCDDLCLLTEALGKDIKKALRLGTVGRADGMSSSITICDSGVEEAMPSRGKRPLPDWPESSSPTEEHVPTPRKANRKFVHVKLGETGGGGREGLNANEPWYGLADHSRPSLDAQENNKRRRRERCRNELIDMDEHYSAPSSFDSDEDLRAWLADRLYRQLCLNIVRNIALGYHPGVWVREATSADDTQQKCVINLNGKRVVLIFDEEEIERYLNGDEDTGFKNYEEFKKRARDWSHDEYLEQKQVLLYGGKARERRYFENGVTDRRRPYGVKVEVYTYNSDPRLWHLFVMRLLTDVIEWTTAEPSSAEPPTVANTKEQIYRSAEEIGEQFLNRLHQHADEVLKVREILTNVRLWQRDAINVRPDTRRRRLVMTDAMQRSRIEYPPRRTSLIDREVAVRSKRSRSIGVLRENDRLLFKGDREDDSWSVDDKALKLRERRKLLAETFLTAPGPPSVGDIEEFELWNLGYVRFNSRLLREETFRIKDKVYCQNSVIDADRCVFTECDIVIADDGHYCVVKLCSGVTMQSLCVPMVHGAVAERLNNTSIKAVVRDSAECMCGLNNLIGSRGARVRLTSRITGRRSSTGTVVQCYKHMVWVRLHEYSNEDMKAYVCLEEKSLEIIDGRFGTYCIEMKGCALRQNASRNVLIQPDSFVRVDGLIAYCLDIGEDAANVLIERCLQATPVALHRLYLAEGESEVYSSVDYPTRAVSHEEIGRIGQFRALSRFGSIYFLRNVDLNSQYKHVSVDVADAKSLIHIEEEEHYGEMSPQSQAAGGNDLPHAMNDPKNRFFPALQQEYDRLMEVDLDSQEFQQDLQTNRQRLSAEIDMLRQLTVQKASWLQMMA